MIWPSDFKNIFWFSQRSALMESGLITPEGTPIPESGDEDEHMLGFVQ